MFSPVTFLSPGTDSRDRMLVAFLPVLCGSRVEPQLPNRGVLQRRALGVAVIGDYLTAQTGGELILKALTRSWLVNRWFYFSFKLSVPAFFLLIHLWKVVCKQFQTGIRQQSSSSSRSTITVCLYKDTVIDFLIGENIYISAYSLYICISYIEIYILERAS